MSEAPQPSATQSMTGEAPQAAPAPNPAPAATPAPSAPSDWTTSFNDDAKGYVQNKGFKDPGMLLESYRNLEKLLGAPKDQVLRLPQKEDDPAWGDIYSKLGKPKEAKEYNLGADEKSDKQFVEWAQTTFHELNLSRAQAEKLSAKFNEYAQNGQQAQQQEMATKHQGEVNVLKREWAGVFEENTRMVEEAAHALNLSEENLVALRNSMGPLAAMRMLQSIGAKIGEPVYHSGEGKSGVAVNTPAQAQARILELKKDNDFVRRYLAGDHKAKAEMDKLHSIAYPATT